MTVFHSEFQVSVWLSFKSCGMHLPSLRISSFARRRLLIVSLHLIKSFRNCCWVLVGPPSVTAYNRFCLHVSVLRERILSFILTTFCFDWRSHVVHALIDVACPHKSLLTIDHVVLPLELMEIVLYLSIPLFSEMRMQRAQLHTRRFLLSCSQRLQPKPMLRFLSSFLYYATQAANTSRFSSLDHVNPWLDIVHLFERRTTTG